MASASMQPVVAWLDRVGQPRGAQLAWAERLAVRLYEERALLVAAGLAGFLAGAAPMAEAARAGAAPERWHVALFASSVPATLWTFALALLATYFDPLRGLVGRANPLWTARAPWLRSALRRCAATTVVGFALAPLAVLLGASL